jgi:hypothetical protein
MMEAQKNPSIARDTLNQCDGCRQGASTNEHGNHLNDEGKVFMVCQRTRYVAASSAAGIDPAATKRNDSGPTVEVRSIAGLTHQTINLDLDALMDACRHALPHFERLRPFVEMYDAIVRSAPDLPAEVDKCPGCWVSGKPKHWADGKIHCTSCDRNGSDDSASPISDSGTTTQHSRTAQA